MGKEESKALESPEMNGRKITLLMGDFTAEALDECERELAAEGGRVFRPMPGGCLDAENPDAPDICRDIGHAYSLEEPSSADERAACWCDRIFPQLRLRAGGLAKRVADMERKGIRWSADHQALWIPGMVRQAVTLADGDCLMLDHPEMGLSPGAQSGLGRFLAALAGTGVRVVVATHSEHLLNGVRIAVCDRGQKIQPEDVLIHFMQYGKPSEEIEIDAEGNLSAFPEDFCDQAMQDLLEIIRLAEGNGQ